MKVPRAGMCVVAVNGLLYVSGGQSSSHDFLAPGTLDSVEVYNPHSDTWTEIGNMITSRCEGGVAVLWNKKHKRAQETFENTGSDLLQVTYVFGDRTFWFYWVFHVFDR